MELHNSDFEINKLYMFKKEKKVTECVSKVPDFYLTPIQPCERSLIIKEGVLFMSRLSKSLSIIKSGTCLDYVQARGQSKYQFCSALHYRSSQNQTSKASGCIVGIFVHAKPLFVY